MAAMEALECSSAQLEPHSLTEISEDDDEVNVHPSEDEDDVLAAAKKELSAMETEGEAAEDKDGSGKPDQQVNGVLVLSLLDKIIGAVDQIQQTQTGLESRQQEMERSVSNIQGELTKLTKDHSTTSNSVNKMMEKVRKVSVNVKTVRANLEKQGGQIKKLETNEAELLKRRNFKVMIYQDEVKVPSKLNVSKSMRVSEGVSGSRGGSMLELKEATEEPGEEGEEGEKENKPTIDLSSDEEGVDIEDVLYETRAERIKRSSLQRVQTLKTVFSKEKMDKTKARTKQNLEKTKQMTKANLEKTKQKTMENIENTKQKAKDNLEKTKHNIEKKMGKLGTRMTVNPERKQKLQVSRTKMQKAFTPDHVVYARSKTAVYKVPPFTFHVKKVRDGAVEVVQGTEMVEVSQNAENFNEVDEEVEGGGVELDMEMMNGGDDEDEDEEEESHDVMEDNDEKDRDSD
ncbi:caveolae-associated protein 1b isoform X1 [Syngnathus acus]|uniref:caveolae-associated protein 1b isoform X1 n=1 Tax=Syngnathus acus TaxID=161584 RepID=UPI00188636FC|nr:caveolae-associated protein 1b isoform X1 [Syngnathus acus]